MSVVLTEPGGVSLELDASISERLTERNKVTQYPVEQGSDVTDNVVVEPDSIRIEGVLADFPLTGGGSAGAAAGSLKAVLEQWRRNATLLGVDTPLVHYDQMVVQEMDVPNDAKSGDTVRFTMTLRQIRIVQTQTVQVKMPKVKKSLSIKTPKSTTPDASNLYPSLLDVLISHNLITVPPMIGALGGPTANSSADLYSYLASGSVPSGLFIKGAPDNPTYPQAITAINNLVKGLPASEIPGN